MPWLSAVFAAATACAKDEAARGAATGGTRSEPVVDPAAVTAIDEGEHQIDTADCARSCAGLAKITQARVTLCSPRTTACDDAERREEIAKRKVVGACGACEATSGSP
jgi:hypothetical protein